MSAAIHPPVILAQQFTVEYHQVEEIDDFFVIPGCIRDRDGCFAVVFERPRSMVVDFDSHTQNRRDRWDGGNLYTRNRSGNIQVLTFPAEGGYVETREPGEELVHTRLRIEPNPPGSVLYYSIEKTRYTEPVVQRQRRAPQRNPSERTDQDFLNETSQERGYTEREESSPRDFRSRDVSKDYRTGFVWAFDYSGSVRTNTPLFRDDELAGVSSGVMFSFTGYYLEGFRSARAGIVSLSSSGSLSNTFFDGYIDEEFEYSHLSVFASYTPSYSIYESRTTYLLLYTDVGASAMYTNFYYRDSELIETDFSTDFFEEIYEINDLWLPGFNLGGGLLFNYKYIGFHLGFLLESTYVESFGVFINSVYPQFGITIRSGLPD